MTPVFFGINMRLCALVFPIYVFILSRRYQADPCKPEEILPLCTGLFYTGNQFAAARFSVIRRLLTLHISAAASVITA